MISTVSWISKIFLLEHEPGIRKRDTSGVVNGLSALARLYTEGAASFGPNCLKSFIEPPSYTGQVSPFLKFHLLYLKLVMIIFAKYFARACQGLRMFQAHT